LSQQQLKREADAVFGAPLNYKDAKEYSFDVVLYRITESHPPVEKQVQLILPNDSCGYFFAHDL